MMLPSSTNTVEIFFSYSHRDEKMRDRLADHLANLRRQGVITAWHDRRISAGQEWAGAIDEHLDSAKIILLLVSPSFMASDYCYSVEVKRAMERHEFGEARVIPVILRPVDWKGAPFEKLQALPKNAKPISQWVDRDLAFKDVVEGIRKALESLATNLHNPLSNENIQDSSDPWKGQFGKRNETNHRKLSATIYPIPGTEFCTIYLKVDSTDPIRYPLKGLVRFFLHPTVKPKHIIDVAVEPNGVAELTLHPIWGAFTVGVNVDNGKTQLELDLSELEQAPLYFRNR